MGVHDGLFTGSIEALASEEQKAEWLPDIYAMKKIGAFGLTEPLGGSDVAGGTRTTAVRDGDNWIINGAKRWIGNATFSDWVVIYARDVGKKGAGILRWMPNIKWAKDRGKDVESAPWFSLGLQYDEGQGARINDHHLSLAEKQAART